MAKLSSPHTTCLLVRAVHFEPIERLLKAFVWEIVEGVLFTAGARLEAGLDSLNALPTEALSTAGDLVRVPQDQQTNWTLRL